MAIPTILIELSFESTKTGYTDYGVDHTATHSNPSSL